MSAGLCSLAWTGGTPVFVFAAISASSFSFCKDVSHIRLEPILLHYDPISTIHVCNNWLQTSSRSEVLAVWTSQEFCSIQLIMLANKCMTLSHYKLAKKIKLRSEKWTKREDGTVLAVRNCASWGSVSVPGVFFKVNSDEAGSVLVTSFPPVRVARLCK